jgi:hypothetical protein
MDKVDLVEKKREQCGERLVVAGFGTWSGAAHMRLAELRPTQWGLQYCAGPSGASSTTPHSVNSKFSSYCTAQQYHVEGPTCRTTRELPRKWVQGLFFGLACLDEVVGVHKDQL